MLEHLEDALGVLGLEPRETLAVGVEKGVGALLAQVEAAGARDADLACEAELLLAVLERLAQLEPAAAGIGAGGAAALADVGADVVCLLLGDFLAFFFGLV